MPDIQNESLQRWRDDFNQDPDTAFDRMVQGMVPTTLSMLSLGELLYNAFDPGEPALDEASARWLTKHIQAEMPEGMISGRWAVILIEYFNAVRLMNLTETGKVMWNEIERINKWLAGYYESPDRDPGGAYYLALNQFRFVRS